MLHLPDDLANLSGTDPERLITSLLQQTGFTAEMTKASGDGGIDIDPDYRVEYAGEPYHPATCRYASEAASAEPRAESL